VAPRDSERELAMARWGLVSFWMKELPKVPHMNARAETVHKLTLFREAFAKRRCLIPATGFFEWQKVADGKQPWRFVREDLEPFAFAGIWEFAKIGDKEILSARSSTRSSTTTKVDALLSNPRKSGRTAGADLA
jgi:putative SOS response-associated peptidase YedK